MLYFSPASLILISFTNRMGLFCSSQNLIKALNNPTAFCSLIGKPRQQDQLHFCRSTVSLIMSVTHCKGFPGIWICNLALAAGECRFLETQVLTPCTNPQNPATALASRSMPSLLLVPFWFPNGHNHGPVHDRCNQWLMTSPAVVSRSQ